jgi:hypothetical protein
MDYNKGAHLAKWQWDVMREPAIFDGVFDSDQEGMMAATSSLLPGDVQRYNTSEFFRMLRLSITNGFEFTSRSFVSPFIGPGASNLRLGANNYTRLGGKRSSKNLTKEIIVENEKLFVNGWEINTANELEAGLLRNFLTGEEKDIYGIDTKKVRINGEEIDFTKIIKTSEDILIALVNNNNYSTLNFYERSIIDIPIIQWKLGYFHAASLLRHWMMGTGATVNLDEQNLIELLDNSNVFQKHLKDAVNVIEKEDNNIDIYKIDRPGVVFRAIHETLEKGEKNIEVKLSEEYKPNDGGINRFYTHLITEKDAVTLSGDITGEDFTASIGAVAIQFYFEGNLEIRGIDNAYLFGNVYYRFFDGFNFIDEKFNRLISQPLGTWDFDIFSPNLQGPSVGFTTQNKDFNSLYKKYGGVIGTTIGISPNFMIYSKYRKLEGWWEFNFISNLISEYCRVKKAK